MNFWQQLLKPFFVLAPMEAVTDTVFRQVIARAAAPDVWFTEFTNATGWAKAGDPSIGTRLVKSTNEHPIVAQLWGSDPESMAKLARHCAELGYSGIDLNAGCPDSHAIKSGSGAALVHNHGLTSELIAALKESGLPVSVKCRLGYTSTNEWRSWISHLLSHDLAALTVHLRTKREMSKVAAHWELMPEIIALRDQIAPQTLIIGNGDVRDRQHGEQLCQATGCDGAMIGRGVFANPFCFEPSPQHHTRNELLDLLVMQLDLHDQISQQYGERKYEPLKRFFKIYIREFEGANDLRSSLMLTRSTAEARELITSALTTAHNNDHKELPVMTQSTSMAGAHYQLNQPGANAVKAIVFDSDGTLIDTRRLIIEGYKTVLHNHGLSHLASESYIRQRLGKPVPETYAAILGDTATPDLIKRLAEEHDEVQNRSTSLIKPYPHTENLLRAWKEQGIKLCLFTSGNRMMIERNFRAAGIPRVDTLFDAIITADDHLSRKPEPDAINELLSRVGVPASQAIVVGDHPFDIQSGKRAAVKATIGILHGLGTQEELEQAGAQHIASDLQELKFYTSQTPQNTGFSADSR